LRSLKTHKMLAKKIILKNRNAYQWPLCKGFLWTVLVHHLHLLRPNWRLHPLDDHWITSEEEELCVWIQGLGFRADHTTREVEDGFCSAHFQLRKMLGEGRWTVGCIVKLHPNLPQTGKAKPAGEQLEGIFHLSTWMICPAP
jgi:hypothetical protein